MRRGYMLNKKSYKKVIITILALTMILGTVALAAEEIYTKQLTATYGRIKFNYEGSDITSQIEEKYGAPAFVVVDKAYAPVRAIADILGVDIEYDNITHTAIITDPKAEEHKKQLGDKDKEIADLKAKIEKLEKTVKEEVKKPDPVKTDLKSLQTSVNKDYGYYKDVTFDISLIEKTNGINVEINTTFMNAKNEYNWGRMTASERKYLVENIVNQVRRNFPNQNVSGFIYDEYNKRSLYSFNQTSNGTLNVSGGGYLGIYEGWHTDANVDLRVREQFGYKGIHDVRLTGLNYAGYTANFDINFSSVYQTQWNSLLDSEIRSMLDNVSYYNDWNINHEYRDNVYINVYMDNILVGAYIRNYSGIGTFTRY